MTSLPAAAPPDETRAARGDYAVVAFDLGSVLVDVERTRVAESLGLPWPAVEGAFFGEGRHDALACGGLSARAYLERAAGLLGVPVEDAERAWASVVRVSEGARALVDAVRVDVVAWSNTDDVHYDALRAGLPERLWARRALSQEVRAAKPDEAFFSRALALLGERPERVVFLDDLAPNVAAARAVGIDAEQVVGVDAARRALEKRGLA